ncbi:MAG TPA: pyridoxamine 5'-phosphate oxidase [Sphingomicrobium sp.]
MADDPIALFDAWYAEAKASEINLPDAMAVATASPDGVPSVRMVLLKEYGIDGFTFYTNADSRKGEELASNPRAALLFHWKSLRRQVRIEGPVEEVSAAQADAYFATRSRDSQLGACASLQSRPLDNRGAFEASYEELKRCYAGIDVPRPPRWTGFRVLPRLVEFWIDRPSRLHERRLFTRKPDGWDEGLLYP